MAHISVRAYSISRSRCRQSRSSSREWMCASSSCSIAGSLVARFHYHLYRKARRADVLGNDLPLLPLAAGRLPSFDADLRIVPLRKRLGLVCAADVRCDSAVAVTDGIADITAGERK